MGSSGSILEQKDRLEPASVIIAPKVAKNANLKMKVMIVKNAQEIGTFLKIRRNVTALWELKIRMKICKF